jgi:hypothetical protein
MFGKKFIIYAWRPEIAWCEICMATLGICSLVINAFIEIVQ